MSSGKRTFQGISWKCLLPGALALFFYAGAVLAFGSMMEEPSVSVFLSGAYPEENQRRFWKHWNRQKQNPQPVFTGTEV